jgi:hypothetical protein
MKPCIRSFGLIATVFGASSAFASPNEIPINTAGTSGFVPLVYGSFTQNAALSLGVEVDGYTFSGQAGDRISIVTSTSGAGLDPVISLRGPTGPVVASTSCNGHDVFGNPILCAVELRTQLASSGIYTLNVADSGANNTGAYTLHIDQYPPVENWLGFGYGAPVQHTIDHLGDSDYFAFNAKAGSNFRLTVATLTAGVDAHVEVWNTAGALNTSTACAGHDVFGNPILCNVLLDLSTASDGIFKVGVYDTGWNNNGNYQISVTCLFGECATGVPSPVPEIPAGWMLGAGIGLICARRLRKG